jgi:apoptosis-inducing factor 2
MKVVILGGGFCGALIAKKLDRQKELEVILIDKKEYFEYSPSLCKLLSSPSYHNRIIIPFAQFLKHTRVITEPVVNVTPKVIETKKEKLSFDYLVIATGIDYPIFLENTKHVFAVKSGIEVIQFSHRIKEAKTILIIGGGLIGTEVAGELAIQTREKQIILLHPHDRLLGRNTKDVSRYAKKYLEEHGVQVIFNERIVGHSNGFFITDTQRRIKAEIGIWCAGIKSNPWYMKMFPSSVFTGQNALKVNHFLQLEGYPNIFVGGDITNIPEEKMAANAERHAQIISKNILSSFQRKPLCVYKPKRQPMVISLGNWNGIITYPPVTIPGFIPAIIKLLIEKVVIKQFS